MGDFVFLREGRYGYLAIDPADGSIAWRVNIDQPLARGVARTPSGFAVVTGNVTLLYLTSDCRIAKRVSLDGRITELRGDGGRELLLLTRSTVMAVAAEDDDSAGPA